MNTERPTPDTDAEASIHEGDWCQHGHVPADFARRLERERDEARKQARYGWERSAEKDAAYGKALAQRDRLLEALRAMLHLCEHDFGMDNESPYIDLANSAIAEVEGGR